MGRTDKGLDAAVEALVLTGVCAAWAAVCLLGYVTLRFVAFPLSGKDAAGFSFDSWLTPAVGLGIIAALALPWWLLRARRRKANRLATEALFPTYRTDVAGLSQSIRQRERLRSRLVSAIGKAGGAPHSDRSCKDLANSLHRLYSLRGNIESSMALLVKLVAIDRAKASVLGDDPTLGKERKELSKKIAELRSLLDEARAEAPVPTSAKLQTDSRLSFADEMS
jgi:hypothetical protein